MYLFDFVFRSYYPIGFLKGNLKVKKGIDRHVWFTFQLTGEGELALVHWGAQGPIGVEEVKKFRDYAAGDILDLIEDTRKAETSFTICGKYFFGNRLYWRHFQESEIDKELFEEEGSVDKPKHFKMLHIDCMRWVAEWWEDGGVMGETPIPPPPIQLLYCTPTVGGGVIISVGKKVTPTALTH